MVHRSPFAMQNITYDDLVFKLTAEDQDHTIICT